MENTEIKMVSIPAGSFLMGSPDDEIGRFTDEGPQHQVTLAGFQMSQTPITQAQWQAVMGGNPSRFDDQADSDQRPVECVSWYDAMEFCRLLSERTGCLYTLPSEAQWEYACRAGTVTRYAFGDTITTDQANYDCRLGQTTPVGKFPANAWGLHDMHGNVWEWCLDDWHDSYEGAPTDGSAWIEGSHSLGKLLEGGPGTTSPGAAARPIAAASSPSMPTTSLASVWPASDAVREDNGLGKLPEGVVGSPSPSSAARLTAWAPTRTPATTTSVSASVASDAAPKLLRGGSWFFFPWYCRSAYRGRGLPGGADDVVGFRVVCLPHQINS